MGKVPTAASNTRHCIQGPLQGPLYIPQNENIVTSDQTIDENGIWMVMHVRVHCWGIVGCGHMTKYQKGSENESCSPESGVSKST